MTDPILNASGDDVTKYVKKLQGLLALAADPGNTPEAREAAQAKAFELMEKYGVDAAMLAGPGEDADMMVRRNLTVTGIYARQLQELAVTIGFGIVGVRPMISGKGRSLGVHYFGYESAVVSAEVIYASLHLDVMGRIAPAWKAAVAEDQRKKHYTAMEKFVWKREFIAGYTAVIGRRLREARERTIKQSAEQGLVGAEVALRDRQAAVDSWADAFSGGSAKQGKLSSHDNSAYNTGVVAGKSAALGVELTLNGVGKRALT